MTRDDVRTAVIYELGRIAPEIDFASEDPDADLHEAFEFDSMDFLNLAIALRKRLGVDVPETDYPRLASVSEATDYLSERLAARS